VYLTEQSLHLQGTFGPPMTLGLVPNKRIARADRSYGYLLVAQTTVKPIMSATRSRLRPILMTSLTLLASMAPFCFRLVPGTEAMIPLARALVGGMAVSTVLTLFLIPCVWFLVKRRRQVPV
ncbi:MAG: efflux RND transporter permease subunit, partial [Pirellulales bacterium]|nr:efflux RND transporter permease subunit [Pirellulales bacterium]